MSQWIGSKNYRGSSKDEAAKARTSGPRTNGKDHVTATAGSSATDTLATTAVPDFLRNLERWILWREITRKGKRTKIPCGLRHGGKAIDVTQSVNWGSYAEAIAAIARAPGAWNGPGIVLGDLGDGTILCGLDLDSCVGPDGELSEWAKRYLAALAGAYSETSPSGTGLKVFFRVRTADFDTIHRILCIDPGKFARKRVYGDGAEHPPAAELFLSHRFFAVTGQEWLGSGGDVALIPVETVRTLGELLGPRETITEGRDDLGDTTDPDETALRNKIAQVCRSRSALRARWGGSKAGLSDTSRSGFDMSLGAMLKAAGFTYGEMRAAVILNEHGAGREQDERYFERIWQRTAAQPPPPPGASPSVPGPPPQLPPPSDHPPPDLDPSRLIPPAKTDPVTQLIAEFNERYFVLNENGRAVIYAPKYDLILKRRFFERMTFADLEWLYSNRLVKIGEEDGQPVFRPAAKVWLGHRERKQFIGGVVFDPSTRKHPADTLNLWRGFVVEPRKGDWGLMRQHILDVICNFDPVLFAYVLDWLADLVQNPAKQGEVALVLRGPEGCGKGVLARAIKYLFGQHGLAISNAKHLVGNFNAHLRDTVFLFVDEAFYAGDKQHVGVLKALITEPYLTIEGKYQNAVQAPNFLHIMLASNEDWVIPASLDSRRYAAIEVQGNKIGAHDYFRAIQRQLDDGGYAAMLYDLLNRDLSNSNLRAVPVTEALQTQRKLSLDTKHAWWLDCLHRGYVFRSKLGFEDHFGQWLDFLPTEILFESYLRYCAERRERRPLPRELFGRWLVETGARAARRRNQAIGEHMVDATTDGRASRIAELVMHPLPHGYVLGDLDTARESFSSASGLTFEWGSEVEG